MTPDVSWAMHATVVKVPSTLDGCVQPVDARSQQLGYDAVGKRVPGSFRCGSRGFVVCLLVRVVQIVVTAAVRALVAFEPVVSLVLRCGRSGGDVGRAVVVHKPRYDRDKRDDLDGSKRCENGNVPKTLQQRNQNAKIQTQAEIDGCEETMPKCITNFQIETQSLLSHKRRYRR